MDLFYWSNSDAIATRLQFIARSVAMSKNAMKATACHAGQSAFRYRSATNCHPIGTTRTQLPEEFFRDGWRRRRVGRRRRRRRGGASETIKAVVRCRAVTLCCSGSSGGRMVRLGCSSRHSSSVGPEAAAGARLVSVSVQKQTRKQRLQLIQFFRG